ncbi:unnamed protein product, partial [marine sediment metagenome]
MSSINCTSLIPFINLSKEAFDNQNSLKKKTLSLTALFIITAVSLLMISATIIFGVLFLKNKINFIKISFIKNNLLFDKALKISIFIFGTSLTFAFTFLSSTPVTLLIKKKKSNEKKIDKNFEEKLKNIKKLPSLKTEIENFLKALRKEHLEYIKSNKNLKNLKNRHINYYLQLVKIIKTKDYKFPNKSYEAGQRVEDT